MASKKNKTGRNKNKSNRRKKKGAGGGGGPPQRKRDDGAALKGMAYGGLIFALIAVFFLVPMGSKTPFNHIVDTLGFGPEAEETAIEGDGAEAPQETVTPKEQKGLDDLIDSKTN